MLCQVKVMKKIIIFTIFIFTSITNFSVANSEECDFGFDIGDNFSDVTQVFGEVDLDKIEEAIESDTNSEMSIDPYIETDFSILCPDQGLELAKIKIYSLGDNKVGGFLVNSKEHISEIDNKDKFIFNYINENYGTIIKETSDPNWLGNTSWEADNKKFYYNKILKFKKLVVEDLLITNNEYKGYF